MTISYSTSNDNPPWFSWFLVYSENGSSIYRHMNRVDNILTEIQIPRADIPTVYNDNQAVLEFIRGNSISKGSRQMELRQWYRISSRQSKSSIS